MKTIDPILLAAQQAARDAGIASATWADSGRLHPVRFTGSTQHGGQTLACAAPNFYVRLQTPDSLAPHWLQTQRITDPSSAGQWAAWADLEERTASPGAMALFWAGSQAQGAAHAVAVWQHPATGDVCFSRSADGLAWSPPAVAYTPGPSPVRAVGVSGVAPGALLAWDGHVYWGAYDPASNTWAAPEDSGHAFTISTPQLAGAYDAAHGRHLFLVSQPASLPYYGRPLCLFTRPAGGPWSGPTVIFTADPEGLTELTISPEPLGGYWWLSFSHPKPWGSAYWWLSRSLDGQYWEDPVLVPGQAATRLAILPPLQGETRPRLASHEDVFNCPIQPGGSAPVVSYRFTIGDRQARVAGGRGAELFCTLDARAGSPAPGLAAPSLGASFVLRRGYVVAGVARTEPAGAWEVVGARWLADGALLEVHAIDAVGLLTTWVADTESWWRDARVDDLVRWLCARAGVHLVTFDASPLWAATLSRFTHPAGENARLSLESLADRVPFEFQAQADGALHFYVPAASPAPQHTYGRAAGTQLYWPGEFGPAQAVNYGLLIGSPARTIGGEAFDAAALAEMGRRLSEPRRDPRFRTSAECDQALAARLVRHAEDSRRGRIEAPPNFALEIGDVLAFDGPAGAYQCGYTWRLQQLTEHFNDAQSSRQFYQVLELRGTA